MNGLEKNPDFWQFVNAIWNEHPMFFMVIVFWIIGLLGVRFSKENSFLEFWINGFTPDAFKKKKSQNRRKDDQGKDQ